MGKIATISIELEGHEMVFLNGGPAHHFNPAFSFSPATLLFETHLSRGAGWDTGVVTWLTVESKSPALRWRPPPQKFFHFDFMVSTLELISGP